jgi:alpha-L-rhamnosidase
MQHFIIAPKPVGDLAYCKSAYNSLYGKVRSEWKKNTNGGLEILVQVPANTSATFVLPGDKKEIKNEAGQDVSVKRKGNKYVVELQAGVYRFVAM